METKDINHLWCIVDYCDNIQEAIKELSINRDSFYTSMARRSVLAFFVEHIGEEASKLSQDFTNAHPEIEWKAIVNFRHRIVHAYAGIDPDVLWDTVENDIPELQSFCIRCLQAHKEISS